MSKYKVRSDKSCLNCGSFVEKKYCPQCGQENKESRESFFHLIIEFVFDLVHFDSSFWKTTRYLLFSPAKLSLEYMAGKRKSYVNPVKLYIFISFLAFFIPAILPTPYSSPKEEKEETLSVVPEDWEPEIDKYGKVSSVAQLDSIHFSYPKKERIEKSEYKTYRKLLSKKEKNYSETPKAPHLAQQHIDGIDDLNDNKSSIDEFVNTVTNALSTVEHQDIEGYGRIKSGAELDSIHHLKASHEQLPFLKYLKYKCAFNIKENTTDQHKNEKMIEFMVHSLPKVLFVYMPIFALWMWIFNLNRRRYYFDSGIFTLHFFSFWLLIITIFLTISCILSDWLGLTGWTYGLVLPLMIIYITFYFFRGNRIFYQERRWLANLKGIFLFVINTAFIIVTSVIFILIAVARSY